MTVDVDAERLALIPGLVDAARERFSRYLTDCLLNYEAREQGASRKPRMTVAFCGYGRSGKDTAGLRLGRVSHLAYGGSTAEMVLPLIAYALNQDRETAWRERSEHRKFWFEFCNELRRDDPTLMAKMALSRGEIVTGIRALPEYQACRENRIIHHAVWIQNSRVEPEPTVEFSAEDCDITLPNDLGIAELHEAVDDLARELQIYRPPGGEIQV